MDPGVRWEKKIYLNERIKLRVPEQCAVNSGVRNEGWAGVRRKEETEDGCAIVFINCHSVGNRVEFADIVVFQVELYSNREHC